MLSSLANCAASKRLFFICDAQAAQRGTKDSLTPATKSAMNAATTRSGRTITRKLTPLARIATSSECRQNDQSV